LKLEEMNDGVDVVFTADSVEFCPIEGLEKLFVCGTYQLIAETKQKIGRLFLFSVENGEKIEEKSKIETAAILDLKWRSHLHDDRALLAQVDAAGAVTIFGLNSTSNQLENISKLNLREDALCLSLDWNDRVTKWQDICL
jgi:diphthamide biosynthesis protein 7